MNIDEKKYHKRFSKKGWKRMGQQGIFLTIKAPCQKYGILDNTVNNFLAVQNLKMALIKAKISQHTT